MSFVSLRLKILGAFLALLGAVLAASLSIVSGIQTRELEAGIRRELEVAQKVFTALLSRREKQLSIDLRLLGSDFAFKKALATRYAQTIESNAPSLVQRIGADRLWIADDAGALFADTDGVMKPGESIAEIGVVASALGEEPEAAVQLLAGRPYQLVAVPILAPELIGVLMAGFRIDDALAAEIKEVTRAEVSFTVGPAIVASTLAEPERAALGKSLGGLPPGDTRIVGPAGGRQLVLRAAVSGEVSACIQRSWDKALEPLRRLQRFLLVIGAAGLALTAAAGFLIAGGVTASMRKLVHATRRLLDGDYGARVDIRSRDEVAELGQAFNTMVQGLQEKEKIRGVLQKAVSKEIADELLKRGEINLGGEERTVTVLFSDIRSFTTLSETLTPAELVEQLNAYFISMSRAIDRHRGVIDKFVGDAIMALFGAPLDTPDDAANAQRAALGMQAALAEHNAERRGRGLPELKIGVGLNTGSAVAGNLGSENRSSYTVIGDSVNLASRLEGLTKHYGVGIIVSGSVRAAAKGDFSYRTLDLVRVKGKSEPVEIFELLAEGPAGPSWLAEFEEGVRAYRGKEFARARELFERVGRAAPGDAPSRLYLERLESLLTKVPDDWEPAHTMTEK